MVCSVLLANNSFAQNTNKPFKVCPEEFVTVKDAPCRILGPTAAVTARMEIPNKDEKKIKELEQKIALLEAKIRELQKDR